jgi:hypothetical protein
MQVITPTAERYGVKADAKSSVAQKLTNPTVNIGAGTRYLRDLINMFPGKLELALAAYNAGEGAVQRAGNRIPNYPETQNYVKTVLQLYSYLKPPNMTAQVPTNVTPTRVRVEMPGAIAGRANMIKPLGLGSAPALAPAPTATANAANAVPVPTFKIERD